MSLRRLLPKPTPDRFAQRVVTALRRVGLEDDIEYDAERFMLTASSGSQINLANIYLDYCRGWPWERGRRLRGFAEVIARAAADELPADFDQVRGRLLPSLRDVTTFELFDLDLQLQGLEQRPFAHKSLTDRLAIALVLDAENGMRLLAESDLEDWGLGFDEALEIGLENLQKITTKPLQQAAPGVYCSQWADCYDLARLLLPRVLGSLQLEGDPVAFCPNWSLLIVTGSRDASGLRAAMAASLQGLEDPKPISGLPIVYRYPGWEPFSLPRGHACFPDWQKLRAYDLAGPYADQKAALDRLHESEGLDVFVATFHGVEDAEQGTAHSYGVWSKGVVALLPETDRVYLFDDERPEGEEVVAEVDWDILVNHCGHRMQKSHHRLPRYLVEDFPSPEEVEVMKASQALRQRAA